KFSTRVHGENARAHVPGSEEARPRGLRPAVVGEVPVDVAPLAAKPLLAGHAMAEAVALLRVQHHLGRPGRAAGEIEDARLIRARRLRLGILACLAETR